jgi:hypothetical protein
MSGKLFSIILLSTYPGLASQKKNCVNNTLTHEMTHDSGEQMDLRRWGRGRDGGGERGEEREKLARKMTEGRNQGEKEVREGKRGIWWREVCQGEERKKIRRWGRGKEGKGGERKMAEGGKNGEGASEGKRKRGFREGCHGEERNEKKRWRRGREGEIVEKNVTGRKEKREGSEGGEEGDIEDVRGRKKWREGGEGGEEKERI